MNEPTELEQQLEASVDKYVLAVDVAHIFWSRWHVMKNDAVNEALDATIRTFRRLMEWEYDGRAWCIDFPPYKRKQIREDYKAQRDKPDPRAVELYKEAQAWLRQRGELVLKVKGYEADDLIGTLCAQKPKGHQFDIYSGDKDLLQLVREDVTFIDSREETRVLAKDVVEKWGVEPWKITQLFALMGDKSDNVPGVPGIGQKLGVELLKDFGDLEGLRKAADNPAERRITKNKRALLLDHWEQLLESYDLVRLMKDAPVEYRELFEKRTPEPPPDEPKFEASDDDEPPPGYYDAPAGDVPEQLGGPPRAAAPPSEPPAPAPEPPPATNEEQAIPDLEPPKPAEPPKAPPADKPKAPVALAKPQRFEFDRTRFAMGLEPRNPQQAWELAKAAHASGIFPKLGSINEAYVVMIIGREMGLTAMASLRGIKMVKGNPSIQAALMQGVCLETPQCEYFEIVETTPTQATYRTKRRGRPEVVFTYTLEEARGAGYLAPPAPGKEPSNWHKIPRTMLRWRCVAELARMVFPEITAGVYVPGEDVGSGPIEAGPEVVEAEFEEAS